jgi:hypothetical protein
VTTYLTPKCGEAAVALARVRSHSRRRHFRSKRWPRRERCMPLLHSSSAPWALSAVFGLRPAFWPQGQFFQNHTPISRLIRG